MGNCSSSSSPRERKITPSFSYLNVADSIRYRGENLKSSFPIYGVHLSYLTEFVSYGIDLLKNKPTSSVVNIVKDLTSDHKTSLIEFLVEQDNPCVGIAEIYICHCWKMKFTDLVEILQDFFKGKDPIIWLDIFSINQHQPLTITTEWLLQVMKPIIGRIHHTLMVFPFWKKNNYSIAPLPLGRSWCLWELYCTLETGSRLQIAMSKSQKKQFLTDFVDVKDDIYFEQDDTDGADAHADAVEELVARSGEINEESPASNNNNKENEEGNEGKEQMLVKEFVKLVPELGCRKTKKRSSSDEETVNINSSLDSTNTSTGRFSFPRQHRSTSNQRQEAVGADERYPSRPVSLSRSGSRSRSSSADSIIHRSLTIIEVEKSCASKVEDKTVLHETISTTVGFTTFNNMISRGLREWLIKLTSRECDKEVDPLKKLMFQENLVFLYLQQGKYEKAERIAKEIVLQRQKKQGNNHPDTIKAGKYLEMVSCKSPLIHHHNTRSVIPELTVERGMGPHG
jgi:hypothetical protein